MRQVDDRPVLNNGVLNFHWPESNHMSDNTGGRCSASGLLMLLLLLQTFILVMLFHSSASFIVICGDLCKLRCKGRSLRETRFFTVIIPDLCSRF